MGKKPGYLKFEPALEREFIKDYNIKAIFFIRLAFTLTIILYALFGILDIWTLPVHRNTAWIIRFGIVIPFIAAMIAISYLKWTWHYIQAAMLLAGIVVGGGIVFMIAAADDREPGYMFYYAGLMIVIFGIYTILRLRFYYAIVSSMVLVAGYEFVAVYIHDMTTGGFSNPYFLVFINNNFFFLSAVALGIFASFTLEFYIRQVFYQRKIIDDDRRRISALLDTIGKEIELARTMQRSIMPDVPPQIEGAAVSLIYKPMEELGGDYYDFIHLGDKRIGIFISDATGHGIPAALVTSMLKTLVSSAGDRAGEPVSLLSYINRGMKDISMTGFVTACYAILDMSSMELVYARAGHPCPVLERDGKFATLTARGGFIGPMCNNSFESKTIQLHPGDRLLFYTDGLTEACDSSNEMFERKLWGGELKSASPKGTPFVREIFEKLVLFRGGEKFDDDVCVIGVEIL